jgi:hypothetical protein
MRKYSARHRYSPEEISFLERNIAGRSYLEITDMFNRHFGTSLALKSIVSALVRFKLKTGKAHRYAPEEIQFIKDNASGKSITEITETFNRKFNRSLPVEYIWNLIHWYKLDDKIKKQPRYTQEEIQFIKMNYAGKSRSELLELYNRTFNQTISLGKLAQIMHKHGLRKIKYHKCTADEIRFLENNINGRSYNELFDMFNLKFNLSISKSTFTGILQFNNIKNNNNNKLSSVGNRCPIGSERVKSDGYIVVKTESGWKLKHKVIWEEAHGEVPKSHRIILLDGDKKNIRLDNLFLVSKREFIYMVGNNLYFPKNAELLKTGNLISKIIIKSKDRTPGAQENKAKERRKKMDPGQSGQAEPPQDRVNPAV